MELKPVKKSEKKLNQIISESKKSNILKKIVFSVIELPVYSDEDLCIYVNDIFMKMEFLKLVGNVTFITTAIFLFLLIKNKTKMKKDTNQDVEVVKKIKKHIKINWIFLIISMSVMIATILLKLLINIYNWEKQRKTKNNKDKLKKNVKTYGKWKKPKFA